MNRQHRILLTGATGYVGGRLLRAFEAAGGSVRALIRDPARLKNRVAATTEITRGDCLDAATLGPAMLGVHTAYYLVHSMGHADSFDGVAEHRSNRGGRVLARFETPETRVQRG